MPNPISGDPPSACDPRLATCADLLPEEVAPVAPRPAVVTIEPVLITGDAGARELLRRYDASQACSAEKQSALLSCPGIATGVLNALDGGPWAGVASAFHASVLCGKDLRAVVDCQDAAETLESSAALVVQDCHDRGGRIGAGASNLELRCEVER